MKTQINKIFKISFISILCLLLYGCGGSSSKTSVIDCVLDMGETQKYEYKFAFSGDEIMALDVTMEPDLTEVSEKDYENTLGAIKSMAETQNKYAGVEVKVANSLNDKSKTITHNIHVDFKKYDFAEDKLSLFPGKKREEVTKDYVIKTSKDMGFSISVDGEKVK